MKTAKVNFNDCIGNDFFFGGISEGFVRYCVEGPNSFDPAITPAYPEAVELHFFNCPGGEVYEGYAIYAYLRYVAEQGVQVSAYIHGLCASIASIVVLAADVRYVGPLGSTMIHKPLVDAGPWANADDHRQAATQLDQIEGQIAAIYASRTGIDPATLLDLMRAETTFTAAEALANGFATAAAPGPADQESKAPAKVLNYAKPKTPAAMATLNPAEKTGLFSEIAAMFGLKPAAKAAAKPKAEEVPVADPAPAAEMNMTEMPLADGTSVWVDTSDDGIEDIDQGDAVWVDEAMTTPVADGTYSLEDGRDFTVAGGVVSEIDADTTATEASAAATTPPAAAKPQPSTPEARAKVAEARALRAEAALKAHVPGSTGNPNKPGAQSFPTGDADADTHPLAAAAGALKEKLSRRF